MSKNSRCRHCDGQGYTLIRDCSGEIQREETCFFCGGTGEIIPEDPEPEDNQTPTQESVKLDL